MSSNKSITKEISSRLREVEVDLLHPIETGLQVLSEYCLDRVADSKGIGKREAAGIGNMLEMLRDRVDLAGQVLVEIQGELFKAGGVA